MINDSALGNSSELYFGATAICTYTRKSTVNLDLPLPKGFSSGARAIWDECGKRILSRRENGNA